MGNQNSYSDTRYFNSCDSSNSYAHKQYRKNGRTHTDLGGAITRLVGQKLAEANKGYKKKYKNERPLVSNNPINLESLYGSNYQRSMPDANLAHLQRSTSDLPPQMQHLRNKPRIHSATPFPAGEIRRPDIDIPHSDQGFQVLCQYCNDTIIPEFLGEHLAVCKQNPQNMTKTCEYCGEAFNLNNIKYHMQNCDARVENLTIPCEFCFFEISLVDHNYHQSTCHLNPKNMIQINKIQMSQFATQSQECAICLLEMKKDSSVRFLECAHKFHTACIEDWSKKKKTCPVCVTSFE